MIPCDPSVSQVMFIVTSFATSAKPKIARAKVRTSEAKRRDSYNQRSNGPANSPANYRDVRVPSHLSDEDG